MPAPEVTPDKPPNDQSCGYNYVSAEDAERPMWLPECCVHPVYVPADTKDHADDPDSTNIGTGAMDVDFSEASPGPGVGDNIEELKSLPSRNSNT
ncbi:hypothetical protein STEG23_021504 [Scotinomys teguina]